MGKLIYQPKGKAYEYCHWACNLYNGCSNLCTYCYNRKGLAHKLLGKDSPTLKACAEDEADAYELFKKELLKYKEHILADGGELFFNFVSDPCLPETIGLNFRCMLFAMSEGVTCRMLTKRAEIADVLTKHVDDYVRCCFSKMIPLGQDFNDFYSRIKIGFTLTGCDDLEPGASTNAERIEAMKILNSRNFYTWASIEPIINLRKSTDMILQTLDFCDEYKIGLLSGKKEYTHEEVRQFKSQLDKVFMNSEHKVLWKESVMEYIM